MTNNMQRMIEGGTAIFFTSGDPREGFTIRVLDEANVTPLSPLSPAVSGQRRGFSRFYPRDDLKIENAAPCGSAITDMRPTPSMVIGGRCSFAPISLALFAVASTSSTWK